MNSNNLLRLSFIISSGHASTLSNNIQKIAKLAIYDSHLKALNINEIRLYIENNYDLEFTNEEIKAAITHAKAGIMNVNGLYSLTLKEIQRIKDHENDDQFESCISKFLDENSDFIFTKDEVFNLLRQYVYEIINSNKQMILLLINNKTKDLDNCFTSISFNNDQRRLINRFLNWDNRNKDIYIFNMISSSIEYCMLTVKKDVKSFFDVFQGKRFLIDTNVILRLIGLNNEERKEVINSFVKKCKEAGIELSYSNYTKIEIENRINSYIEQIPVITNNTNPINPKYINRLLPTTYDSGIYNIYFDWCMVKTNYYNDYDSFKHYVYKLYRDAVKDFRFITITSFKDRYIQEYKQHFDSLKAYKTDGASVFNKHFDQAIDIDINNFMYILHKRKNGDQGHHFWDVNDYLISTDNKMCKWSRERYQGIVPLVLLPSIWHSIILKYKGRTDNDYKAFSLFLNLRYKKDASNENSRLLELLKYINLIPEDTHIKERVIDKIDENLNGESLKIEPKILVEKAYERIKEEDYKKKEAELLLTQKELIKNKEIEIEDNTIRLLANDKANNIIKNEKKFLIPLLVLLSWIVILGLVILGICIIVSALVSDTSTIVKIISFTPLVSVLTALAKGVKWVIRLKEKMGLVFDNKRSEIFNAQYKKLKIKISGVNNMDIDSDQLSLRG